MDASRQAPIRTSDFTDAELEWLEKTEKVSPKLPDDILAKLVISGVVDSTGLGPKITGLGRIVLDEARNIGRLPRRT